MGCRMTFGIAGGKRGRPEPGANAYARDSGFEIRSMRPVVAGRGSIANDALILIFRIKSLPVLATANRMLLMEGFHA